MSSFSRRPRFQLSLRSLFVLFLLACGLVGVGIKWRQQALVQQRVVRLLEPFEVRGGGPKFLINTEIQFTYDYEQTDDPVQQRLFSPKPSWLSSIFGVDMVHSVKEVNFVSGEANRDDFQLLQLLGSLTHLELLSVDEVSDWESLYSIKSLRSLSVHEIGPRHAPSADARASNRFENISNLSRLNELHLGQGELEEAEWNLILQHPALKILKLSRLGVPLPNSSLADASTTKIRKLYLSENEYSQEAIISILSEMPHLNFLSIKPDASSEIKDQIFESISKLEKLEQLFLHGTTIQGHELHRINKLPIKEMGLGLSNLDDRGLENLVGFKKLNYLEIGSTKVSDLGMKSLAQLSGLKYLSIRDTKVTDEGFLGLAKIKGLKTIRIRDTLITEKGVQQFRKLLPACAIDVR